MTTLRSLIDTQAPGRQAPLFETRQGNMELLVDVPGAPLKGIALIAHPQPLLGGSARHKIPFSLARALSDDAWLAIRPNFRGVGRSEGEHDQGEGESDDLLCLVHALRDVWPALPIALIGFSFGAYVQARVANALAQSGQPAEYVVLLGLPVGLVPDGRFYATPSLASDTLLIHGEHDEHAPLALLSAHVRKPPIPIVMVPGADHFFSNGMAQLLALVRQKLAQG